MPPCTPALDPPAVPRTRPWQLGRTPAFVLLASLTVSFLAGSIAPTPLYPLYQARWGFSATAVTLVFGVYALAVLATLLTLGRLSDSVGRRPVLLATTLSQALTMGLFAGAGSLDDLLVARVVQGIATGAALSAIGATLLDLDRDRGATANAIAPPLGSASGGLLAGVVVQFLPAPTRLVYLLLAVLFLVQALGVLMIPETVRARPLRLGSLLPRLRVPPASRATFLAAAPVLVATWALAGFYGSLGPALVHGLLGGHSPLLSGVVVFVMAGSAALSIALLAHRPARPLLTYGTSALIVGTALTLAAVWLAQPLLFFTGTAIAGSGFGTGFQGAVRSVVAVTPQDERAEMLAVVFVVAYLAMGLPVMAAGWLVTHRGGILAVTQGFALTVMLLSAGSLWVTLRQRPNVAGR